MDATELLNQVRAARGSFTAAAGPEGRLAAAELLAARFGALDELLGQGGQPPDGWPLGPSGADLTDGAGPDDFCGCGEPITVFEGRWVHVYNPELRGTDDHDAEP